jgi:hypothetical protein
VSGRDLCRIRLTWHMQSSEQFWSFAKRAPPSSRSCGNTLRRTFFQLLINYITWRVQRHQGDAIFDRHKHVGNRMVLWHGARIEVIAAILAKGLRNIPHAHGCVG